MTISELFVGHKFFSLSVSQSVSLLAGSQSIDMLARVSLSVSQSVSQTVRQSDSQTVRQSVSRSGGQVVSWSFSQVVSWSGSRSVSRSVDQLVCVHITGSNPDARLATKIM